MNEYTYDSPGCYHDALNYLSSLTGISKDKEITINRIEDLYIKSKKKKLKYRSYNIRAVDKDGNSLSFMQGLQRFDLLNPLFVPIKFVCTTLRGLDEFNIRIEKAGNYNDSLGDGWHQTVGTIKINDKFFAYMDCTCNNY